MKLTADYHTHTTYSDGKNSAAENAVAAEKAGLSAIAITEHGYSHIFRGIARKETEAWLREVHEADKLTRVQVLTGIESNIRGISGLCDLTEQDYENFDVYLAGIHIVIRYEHARDRKIGWGGWFRRTFGVKPSDSYVKDVTRAYINAIKNNPIDIITHLNYQTFADALEVAKCCADYGTYLEISSKKPHLTDDELAKCVDTGVRFVVNSDAHSVDRIGDTKLAEEIIARVGVPLDRIDNIDGRLPNFRFAEFKKHM